MRIGILKFKAAERMDEEDDDISADDWDIKGIVLALEHLNIRYLELRSGASDPMSQDLDMTKDDEYKGFECTAPKSTPLKSLTLIDCNITTPDLHNMLRYPKTLQYLSICTQDPENTYGVTQTPNRHVVWDDVFDGIAQEVGASLIGFRFSPNPRALVPAPNLHKLTTLRYLELHHHLLAPLSPIFNTWNPNSIEVIPLTKLLPPNLEVLKILYFDFPSKGREIIGEILADKEKVVACLRRVVVQVWYEDEGMEVMLRGCRKAVGRDERVRAELEGVVGRVQAGLRKKEHVEMEGRCKARGVELMVLFENVVRREVLGVEGDERAVWEVGGEGA